MRLGQMIDELKLCRPDAIVRYDFTADPPCGVDSWRGIYAELALGHDHGAKPATAKALVEELSFANGFTYHGYKGGEYTMDLDTDVHADNYGEYTEREIVGIDNHGDHVVIRTYQK